MAIGSSAAAGAQQIDPRKLAEVKAAFVLNFVRYTTWPDSRFDGPESPYRVAVVGNDLVADRLTEMARRSGALVDNRAVSVVEVEVPARLTDRERDAILETLRDAHVVYVASPGGSQAMDLLADLRDHDVLTVGDAPGFAAAGGMIGLWRDGDRVVFDCNRDAIRATDLAISARVLKLARIVAGGGGR